MVIRTPSGTYRAVLRQTPFTAMWAAQTLSNLGDSLARIALMILITQKTDSPVALTIVALAQAIPVIVLGPLAGILVDRVNRKCLMVGADLLRTVIVAVVIFAPNLSVIYILAGMLGAAGTVFNPARSAVMPELAGRDNYMAAVGLTQVATQGAMILGPALGGLLIGTFGTAAGFAIDAASFLVSALTIAFLPIPPTITASSERAGALSLMTQGIRVIWKERALRFIFGVYIPVIFVMGSTVSVLFVDYLRNVLRVGATRLGLVEGIVSAGLILSTALVGTYGKHMKAGTLILNSVTGLGAAFALFLVRPCYGLVVGLAAVIGAADGLSDVPFNALLLTLVPPEKRGRVFASYNALARLVGSMGLALAGPLAAASGTHVVIGASGLLVVIIGLGARKLASYRILNSVSW